jgi:hypothetical protein
VTGLFLPVTNTLAAISNSAVVGNPLSPMLFNIVANMLTNMIERVKVDGQIEGVIPYFMDGDYQSFNMKMTQFFLWSMILRRLETFN